MADGATRDQKIMLLLNTYLDVMHPDYSTSDVSSAPDSVILSHSTLYYQGSYRELDRALGVLRERAPKVYWHVVRFYIEKNPFTDGNGGSPAGRRLSERKAQAGLAILSKKMPARVYVPAQILFNAGFYVGGQKVAA